METSFTRSACGCVLCGADVEIHLVEGSDASRIDLRDADEADATRTLRRHAFER